LADFGGAVDVVDETPEVDELAFSLAPPASRASVSGAATTGADFVWPFRSPPFSRPRL